MRALVAVLLLAAVAPAPAPAAPRLAVWLPEGQPPAAVQRAFGWSETLVVLEPAQLATRFPHSPAALARAATAALLTRELERAASAFVETDFAAASAALDRAAILVDTLPPAAGTHQAFVRISLLRARLALAGGRADAAAAAFGVAAAAAPDLQLDEAEYPPEVIRAYQAARLRALQQPPRTLTVTSVPAGADVELNGRLWGRAPTTLKLPPGRCRLLVTRPGYEPLVAPCGDAPQLTVRLAPAAPAARHDQLRERLQSDPRWFVDQALLDALGAELGVHWIVTLERGRGGELEARLYWVRQHTFRALQPARYGVGELGALGAQVRRQLAAAEGLAVTVHDPLTRAPMVDARAGDPEAIARAVVFVRRPGQREYRRQALTAAAAGRFSHALPKQVLAPAGAALAVEYYVEGYGADGAVRSRVGDATHPRRFARAALPVGRPGDEPPRTPGWYTRWYVWAGVAAVVLGVTLGTYYAVRPTDAVVVFAVRRP